MADAESGPGSAGIAAALRALPGVAAARIEDDGGPGLGRLRLSLLPGVDEAAVAGSVGRLLQEDFGIDVDVDRVQVEADPTSRDSPGADGMQDGTGGVAVFPVQHTSARPAINRLQLSATGLDVTATVSLSTGESLATGTCSGPASTHGTHKAVATATLRAVQELLDGQVRLDLDHLEIAQLGSERTVLVRATLLTEARSEGLTGVAVVRDDVRQAVIRATLAAVNRRFELLRG